MLPLDGIVVLDFGTLLPVPLATLIFAEAGAEVIKIERPGHGDEMRTYQPRFGSSSANFGLLNRGKASIVVDLKASDAIERLTPLIERADIVFEQFRPGVMDRLGLGYDALRVVNPGLIYCSVSGYGQDGPLSGAAGHDLNYMAQTGLLGLAIDADGTPSLPPALIADIAGGTYPAVINVLLALRERDRTGVGCHLDIAMCENVFPFAYWAFSQGFAGGAWPQPGRGLVTGGSPRYAVYRAADGRFIAAAPIEDRFWTAFCDAIDLPAQYRDDSADPEATRRMVAAAIAARPSSEWRERFAPLDVCCAVVATIEEATASEHFRARGVFAHRLCADGNEIPALPLPLAARFRRADEPLGYPALGADAQKLQRS